MNSESRIGGYKFGRIIVDDTGIRLLPVFKLFGRRFNLKWSEIREWATNEAIIKSSGKEYVRALSSTLELHTSGEVHFVTRKANDKDYGTIVGLVRSKIPDRETKGVLSFISQSRIRRSRESTRL